MANDGEGTIYIPLDEFWVFVRRYAPVGVEEIRFGVPRVTEADLEIDYAFSTECAPEDWAQKPKAILQWAEVRARGES